MKLIARLVDPVGGDVVIPSTITPANPPMQAVAEVTLGITLCALAHLEQGGDREIWMSVELDGRRVIEQRFGRKPVKRIVYRPEDIEE